MSDKSKPNPLINLAAGGISGAVSKTITAPLEKIKLAIQNQDSNPRVLSGEMKKYTGMGDCFSRHVSELGATSLWRGNVANCVRYVPTAAFNLMFKDTLKAIFPKVDKKDFAMFAATQVASGSLAGGLTNTLVYPLIYVRTVLGADLGKVKQYNNMMDCIGKTVKWRLPFALQRYRTVHDWHRRVPWRAIRSPGHHQGLQPVAEGRVRHRLGL
jgi:solute carrier family 25 (adenine nucleotide translocator) protein 4/5/6/31